MIYYSNGNEVTQAAFDEIVRVLETTARMVNIQLADLLRRNQQASDKVHTLMGEMTDLKSLHNDLAMQHAKLKQNLGATHNA